MLIARVAEGADRILQVWQLRHRFSHELLIVAGCAVRWIPFAPGADDHKKVIDLGKIGGFGIGHVDDLSLEVRFLCSLLNIAGELLGIARLGAVKNSHRLLFDRGGKRGCRSCGATVSGEADACEKSGEPGGLIRADPGAELLSELLLIRLKRIEIGKTHVKK